MIMMAIFVGYASSVDTIIYNNLITNKTLVDSINSQQRLYTVVDLLVIY